MGFLKSKAGLLAVLAALAALLGVLWYCFEGNGAQKIPEGTLVRHRAYGTVSLMADGAGAVGCSSEDRAGAPECSSEDRAGAPETAGAVAAPAQEDAA